MKKILFFTLLLLATSCVSKSEYEDALAELRKLENEYQSLEDEYHQLKQEYEELEYDNDGNYGQLDYLRAELTEKIQNINQAKSAIANLKSDFDAYLEGWYDASQIQYDIQEVENKLNGF